MLSSEEMQTILKETLHQGGLTVHEVLIKAGHQQPLPDYAEIRLPFTFCRISYAVIFGSWLWETLKRVESPNSPSNPLPLGKNTEHYETITISDTTLDDIPFDTFNVLEEAFEV